MKVKEGGETKRKKG